jgi:hypothetical protein
MTSFLLRDRISVVAERGGVAETPLHEFLAEVLGRNDFVTSLRLAPGRPNSKPIVQAVANDGRVLAFGKFGWEPLTRRLVHQEGNVLAELGPLCQGTSINVPEVLYHGSWRDFEVLVVAPLTDKGRTPRSLSEIPVTADIKFLHQKDHGRSVPRGRSQVGELSGALGPKPW